MIDRVCLDWQVPSDEWDRFRRFVESEFESLEGYLGREAESAMKEYARTDGYEDVESKIDRLVEAAGRRPDGSSKEKKFSHDGGPTTRVQVRIDPQVKDEFRAVADQGENCYGIEFAKAISQYRDGGRAQRLEEKLDRILGDAESLLSEASDSTSDQKLGKVDRNVITICNRLSDQFTDDELNAEIHDVSGHGRRASEPTVEKYRDLVLERLGVEPHPVAEQNPETGHTRVWVPAERAEELAPEGTPRVCRIPVDLLERDERVERIQLAAGRRAAKRDTGTIRVGTADVADEILDGEVSKSSVLSLMDEVSLTDGFTVDTSGPSASIKVNLTAMKDREPDLLREIIEYRDADAETLLSETTESTVTDYTQPQQPVTTEGADDQLDTIMNAATDGGGPRRHNPDSTEVDDVQ